MNNNIYELKFDENLMDGVYGISLVQDPAIGVMALKFSKEDKNQIQEWKLSSEEKRIIVSPVLIPNQRVYRNDIANTGEGYVFVSEQTIEKLQQNFFKNQFSHNSSIEHLHTIDDGVFVFESWIIEDPLNDKSNSLGFENLPKGTWMVSIKIENDSVWNNYIRTGKVLGISMDALLQPVKIVDTNEEIKFNNKMKRSNLKLAFKKAFTKVLFAGDRKEFKISDELSVFADADELTVGVEVFKADGEKMVESEFEYDGKLFKVNAEGKIETIEEINANDPQLNFEFSDEEIEAIVEEIKDEIIVDYEKEVADLKAENAELKAKLAIFETAEAEAVELKKQTPASKGIQTKFSNQGAPKGILGAMRSIK